MSENVTWGIYKDILFIKFADGTRKIPSAEAIFNTVFSDSHNNDILLAGRPDEVFEELVTLLQKPEL